MGDGSICLLFCIEFSIFLLKISSSNQFRFFCCHRFRYSSFYLVPNTLMRERETLSCFIHHGMIFFHSVISHLFLFFFGFAQMNVFCLLTREKNQQKITYLAMDCYSFRSKVSPLDIQMLFDSQSYNKTISFLTINRGDICTILGCMFPHKLSCGCLVVRLSMPKRRTDK